MKKGDQETIYMVTMAQSYVAALIFVTETSIFLDLLSLEKSPLSRCPLLLIRNFGFLSSFIHYPKCLGKMNIPFLKTVSNLILKLMSPFFRSSDF